MICTDDFIAQQNTKEKFSKFLGKKQVIFGKFNSNSMFYDRTSIDDPKVDGHELNSW